MKHTTKRFVSLLCAAVMLFTLLGGTAVFAAGAENIALYKPAVATYEENGSNMGYAWKANDGDLSTRWSTAGDPDGGIPGAVMIDLEAESRIDSTEIFWFMDGRSFTYDIYVTDEPVIVDGEMDLTGLTPAVSQAKGTGSGNGTAGSAADAAKGTANTMPANTLGRYVTVVVTASGGSASVLWELEIYGEILGEIPPKNITSIGIYDDIYVPYGTALAEIDLADTAAVTLENGKVEVVDLKWSGDYNANKAGTYTLTGTPVWGEDQNIANGNGVTASVTVIVAEENAAYEGRQKYNMNKGWSFYRGAASGAEAADFDDSAWTVLSLPHTWNAEDGQDGGSYYRGDGWYRKSLVWGERFEGKQVVIEFLGANSQSWVYVNGTEVGHHIGGYTAFRYDITDLLVEGENVIAVRVNNAHSELIAPQSADFTFYGGLYRDVSLIVTDPVHIDTLDVASEDNSASSGLRLATSDVSAASADLNISSVIVNDSDEDKTVTVKAVLRHPDSFEEVPGVDPVFDVEDMIDPNGYNIGG